MMICYLKLKSELLFTFQLLLTAKEFGYVYISALSDFRRDGCLDCYFPYDGHMTKSGHERVAKILIPQMVKLISEDL